MMIFRFMQDKLKGSRFVRLAVLPTAVYRSTGMAEGSFAGGMG
jgi:hypothetical protein